MSKQNKPKQIDTDLLEAVQRWAQETRELMGELYAGRDADIESQIAQTINNIRHICDEEGLDFAAIGRKAYNGYVLEVDKMGGPLKRRKK